MKNRTPSNMVLVWAVALLAAVSSGLADGPRSSVVRAAIGLEGDRTLATRLEAVWSLSKPLAPADQDALLNLLSDTRSYTNLELGQQAYFLNEVMNKLRAVGVDPRRLTESLTKMALDESQPNVIRDYAIQHLASFYGAAGNEAAALETFFSVLDQREGTVAGTALRALYRLSERDGSIDRNAVAVSAFRIAGDDSYDIPSRAAALQLCGSLQHAEALLLVRDTAASVDAHRVLRMAALNALGHIGEPQDAEFLQSVARSGGIYARAARAGHEQLLKRMEQEATQTNGDISS